MKTEIQCVSGIWTSLIWLWWFGLRLMLISTTVQAASTRFKSGSIGLKNNHITFFAKVKSKSLTHSVDRSL